MNYNTEENRNHCARLIEAAFARAEELWQVSLRRPTLLWRNCGGTAGYADYNRWELTLSPWFLERYGDAYIEDTPLHEAAHFIARVVFKEDHHGGMFYAVLRAIGGKSLTRCHTFLTAGAPRETRRTAKIKALIEDL